MSKLTENIQAIFTPERAAEIISDITKLAHGKEADEEEITCTIRVPASLARLTREIAAAAGTDPQKLFDKMSSEGLLQSLQAATGQQAHLPGLLGNLGKSVEKFNELARQVGDVQAMLERMK